MLTAANLADIQVVRHGFFTREGGVSQGKLASLNCGYSGGDEPDVVNTNRELAMKMMGVTPSDLCTVKQVHGTDVHVAREPGPGTSIIEADALVTDRPDLAIGVLSADCAPVLAADSGSRCHRRRSCRLAGCACRCDRGDGRDDGRSWCQARSDRCGDRRLYRQTFL